MERKNDFVNFIQLELQKKTKYNKTSLEKIAATYGIVDQNHVKEYTELAIVNQARKLAHTAGTVKNRFEAIVDLYQGQVNLSHRTSTSMLLQQYSTPAPIAYLAGVFAGINEDGFYFEPSAGNGLLTIASKPEQFIVNEIDDVRRANLETQGFFKVLNKDATEPFPYDKSFDAIITNPPFGKLDSSIDFNGYAIGVLDHLMCIRVLNTMKDNGRAALIIGGHTTWDDRGRIQAGKNRMFFSYLHEFYNVVDSINIDGHKLYSRQGTSFDVRLILIAGRKETPGGFAPLYDAETDKVVYDFNALYKRVNQYKSLPASTVNFEFEAAALELELELMNEVGLKGLNVKKFRKDAIQWAYSFLANKRIFVPAIDDFVLFKKSGLKHSLSTDYFKENILAEFSIIQKLPDLLLSAKYKGFEKSNKVGKNSVKGVHTFLNTIEFENKKYEVWLIIREDEDKSRKEKFYYDHGIIQEKEAKKSD